MRLGKGTLYRCRLDPALSRDHALSTFTCSALYCAQLLNVNHAGEYVTALIWDSVRRVISMLARYAIIALTLQPLEPNRVGRSRIGQSIGKRTYNYTHICGLGT